MESPPAYKDAPAFDFYPERWLAGVAEFSDLEQLAYLRLLCFQWLRQGLPAELEKLRRLAGKGVTEALLTKFPVEADGRRRNPRLETVRAEQRARIEKKKEQRRNAANKRWHPDGNATAMRPHNGSIAGAMPTTHHPPPTQIERENTPARLAQVEGIANAYCRQDAPLEVREAIAQDLDAGTSYEDFRRAVNLCMEHIRAAPGGASNQYVPKALTFFQQRQWRSPEAFAERWKSATPRPGAGSRERVVLTTPNAWGTRPTESKP